MKCAPFLCVVGSAALALSSLSPFLAGASVAEGETLFLENEFLRLEFDRERGTMLRLFDKAGKIDLHSRPELAENFRLLVAVSDDPANYVLGKDQRLAKADLSGGRLVLRWDGPMRDAKGRSHAIQAEMTIVLAGPAAEFRFKLANRTDKKVQEVWCPGIGGLLEFGPPEGRGETTLNPPPHHAKRIGRPFGAYSASYPGQNMGYVEIGNPAIRRGLYLGSHDPIARFRTFHFVETGAGEKSNLVFHLMHYPSIPAGGSFESGTT